MKKKFLSVLAALLLVAFSLSGCSEISIATIDEMILPPKAIGENADVFEELSKNINGRYSLKTPVEGEYRSSFVYEDINSDNIFEVFAFYQFNDESDKIHMALIDYKNGKRNFVQDITFPGGDIKAVDFADFNNDGVKEIVVCWYVNDVAERQGLSVYSYKCKSPDKPLTQISDNLPASEFKVLDLNEDSRDELLVLNLNFSKTGNDARANVYSFDDKEHFTKLYTTPLDGAVTEYTQVLVDNTNAQKTRVYVDGNKGENFMVTELIEWDKSSGTLSTPWLDSVSNSTTLTAKGTRINSRDIDNDGSVEVAFIKKQALQKGTSNSDSDLTTIVDWCKIENFTPVQVVTSLVNMSGGYMVNINKAWADKVVTSYDSVKREWKVLEWDFSLNSPANEIFTILAVERSQWEQEKMDGYKEIATKADLIYVARINDQKGLTTTNINYDDLKANFIFV